MLYDRPDLIPNPWAEPAGEHRWGYYATGPHEFDAVVHQGIKTKQTANGRGVRFTSNPRVARAKRDAVDGELVRFPIPANATRLPGESAFDYNFYVAGSISRREIQVYLAGDLGDDNNWIPIGQLR